jgi:hypothetical protein
VKIAYLADAAKSMPLQYQPSKADLVEAAGFSIDQIASNESVTVSAQKKPKGGYRPICAFGWRNKAIQLMAKDVIDALYQPRSFQFGLAGKGPNDCIGQIRTFYEQGLVNIAHLDVKAFYDNFDAEGIMHSLPVPKILSRNAVIGQNLKLKGNGVIGENVPVEETPASALSLIKTYISGLGQLGIPQGSACSPTVAGFYISKLNLAIPAGCKLVNYVDDFLIMSETPEGIKEATKALDDALASISVGKFELSGSNDPEGSFITSVDFLGYTLTPHGKHLVVAPTALHWEKYFGRLLCYEEKLAKTFDVYLGGPRSSS